MSEREGPMSAGKIAVSSLYVGIVTGVISGAAAHLTSGSEAVGLRIGLEVVLGVGSGIAGYLLARRSAERAENFTTEGEKTKAYVEALKATMAAAIGLAVVGSMVGDILGGRPWAIVGGAAGLVFTGMVAHLYFHSLSTAFRERNSVNRPPR